MMKVYTAVLAILCVYSASAYKVTMKMSQPTFQQSVMRKVSGAVVASALLLSSFGSAMPAMAAVGEGDLPPGAMAFQKLLKYQVRHQRLALFHPNDSYNL
jgi:hypothetical protein